MATALRMPQLGITMTEGKVVRWLKQEGDTVRRGEPVMEIETDKLNAEVEATTDGLLRRRSAQEGESVKIRGLLGIIAAPEEPDTAIEAVVAATRAAEAAPGAAPAARPARPAGPAVAAAGPRAATAEGRVAASPVAKRLAQELGVDLTTVAGTGPGGRITESDVRAAAERRGDTATVAEAEVPASPRPFPFTGLRVRAGSRVPASIEMPDLPRRQTVPLAGMRRLIAERLTYSLQSSAQLTLVTEVDAGALVAQRAALAAAGEPESQPRAPTPNAQRPTPTYTDLLVFLVARALHDHPLLNASLVGEEIICWGVVNMGLAVAVERGLIVPVVREADRKTLAQITAASADLVARARANRLTVDELRDGTFTITNLGMYEIDAFTPIVNPPQCAILGVGRIVERPVARDGELVIRPTVTLSLSFDHRIVDGAPAAAFLQQVRRAVEAGEIGGGRGAQPC